MKNNQYAVIMAGGIGSRFWPVSTSRFPKQFQDLLGCGQSLLQKTFSRLSKFIPPENIFILTNKQYVNLTLEQLPQILEKQIIAEPAMRNTAACILLASLKIDKQDPNALILVAPSDHWIEDETAFENDIQLCFDAGEKENILLTLGIHPTFPNTGFGYIESGLKNESGINKVNGFREKPDYETAKQFIANGNFLWNAGIFIWSSNSILDAFKKHMPEMHQLFLKGLDVLNTSNEEKFILENYEKAGNISIDYGILEKAENVYVKKATFDWNDLGTWGALHEKMEKDENGNVVVNALSHLENAKGNIIFTTTKKLVVIEGLQNYIIVDKGEVLMVYPKNKEQEIKLLLKEISDNFGESYT